ncbi:MAG: ATP-binding protein [Erysipelotrichaceae bacterium]|nr:ATP-binding protein [Erysipelotrichaceae bacterium]
MNVGLLTTAISLLYIILITGVYFMKKRISLLENKIYVALLIATIIGFSVNIISFLLDIYFSDLLFLRIFLVKIYYAYLLTFLFCMTLYLLVSSKEKRTTIQVINFIYILVILVNFILPIEFIQGERQLYLIGSNVYFIYLMFIIAVFGWGSYICIKLKNLNKKKYIPMLLYIVSSIPVILIQTLIPDLLLETTWISLVLVLMYHTIENPDLKIMNELELAKKNAEKANEAKTNFLSSMSHEIRTPLNAIVGFSNSILEDTSLEEAKTEAKDIIMASNNLLEIVNGILDISKIEAGKMEMVEVEYSPRSVFEDITKLILPRLEEKPIELKTDFSSDLPAVLYGDMGKVREIITNLLTNAVKYTNKGMIVFQVSCINQKGISKLVISVEDTGRGIKPEKIDKLFTKFQRLEEDRNTTLEGTGLGLAITKNLVEMMGGKIVVQSKYGSGSKFTVYLKQKIVKMVSETVEVQDEENTEIVDYSDKKILVVDDNMLNIKVATRLLKNYNIVPDTVLSGEEALKKVKEEQYDLIFMDDMMPKLSGVETFQKMQEDKNFKVPVVVLTANAITGMREKYLSVGFTDYLAKPIDKLELERILKENLDKKKGK